MKAIKIVIVLIALLFSWQLSANQQHRLHGHDKLIVVIIPSYNNIKWYKQNLDSLQSQLYRNWRAIYIDDCSTDGTGQAVADYIAFHKLEDRITLIRNNQNQGGLYNLYHAIHSCDDNEIVVTCDGDDWFYDDKALSHVNQAYRDGSVWMTYGAYQEYPTGTIGATRAIPQAIIEHNAFRQYDWLSTHLRTFYAGLFKRIKKEDLLYDGKFYSVTWDQAMMFPMLEMAGTHSKHLGKIAYIYNIDNPINDFKKDLSLVLRMSSHIKAKEKYNPITSLRF